MTTNELLREFIEWHNNLEPERKNISKASGNIFLKNHRPEFKNLDIPLVSVSFDSLIDRLECASNIKYPNRQWTALFKAEQKMNWKGKDKLLLERVERLESELYER